MGAAKSSMGSKRGRAQRALSEVSSLEQAFNNRFQYKLASQKTVNFTFDSSRLGKGHYAPLDEVAEAAQSDPSAIVLIEGRTDSTGEEAYNLTLGERRADAVIHYLVVEKGVHLYKIHKISFGEAKPLEPNADRQGRAQNRAVVIRVLFPESASQQVSALP